MSSGTLETSCDDLAATLFELEPPQDCANGRELLDTLIHDCAHASRGELELIAGDSSSLALPSWARQEFTPLGLYRLVDLRFRVLWPGSESPGLEVCGGNRFMQRSASSSRNAVPISPHEIHERFPEAAQWLRNTSDISLKTHIHAASVWFRAAQRAGWAPRRIPLEPVAYPQPEVRSGRGIQQAAEPFKSIMLSRAPLGSPGRIDLNMVGRLIAASSTRSVESAFRKWWPMLPLSIRTSKVGQSQVLGEPELGLLVIPGEEDIHRPPWIDWLRANEAAGRRFRIVRESTLGSSSACSNLTFDLFMLAGGIPWTAVIDDRDRTVLGLDAGHDREQRSSRWVCARVDSDRNEVSCTAIRTELAEHIPDASIERLLPSDRAEWKATVFRDGRFHTERRQDIAPNGMTVSVVKHPRAVIYRNRNGVLRPARFGDALRYPDNRILLQTSSNRDIFSSWKMPIRLGVDDQGNIERAVALTVALCRQPALGVFQQPRLPVPIYWADLISKTTSEGWPKVVGRGLGLESIIP